MACAAPARRPPSKSSQERAARRCAPAGSKGGVQRGLASSPHNKAVNHQVQQPTTRCSSQPPGAAIGSGGRTQDAPRAAAAAEATNGTLRAASNDVLACARR
eukprot:scaffold19280_cov116-Isochrysis_galbana.AAC.6